jgi:hypothetical protein
MRSPTLTPRLAPEFDVTVHIVLDELGSTGRVYRETDEERAGLDTVIDDFLTGQFNSPVRVVAFNTAEGWSRDISEDVAWEVLRRATNEGRSLPASTYGFVEFHMGEDEALRVEAGLA